jgi:3-oxoacyl-[acyl-carrier protein] reductase
MKLLEGKVAIITGASRGIGKGIAEVFAKNGANVAFTYSSSVESAQALENELNALGIKAKGYQSNAADFNEAQKFVDAVLADFGTVDILINNAGITKDNLMMRMSEADFDQVIDVNLKSVFNMTKAIQKTFLKQRSGSIINMSSVVGVKGNAGQTNYAASKAGVIGFSKSVALELGSRNIRCNANMCSSSSVAFPRAETTTAICSPLVTFPAIIATTLLIPSPFDKDFPPNFNIFIILFFKVEILFQPFFYSYFPARFFLTL